MRRWVRTSCIALLIVLCFAVSAAFALDQYGFSTVFTSFAPIRVPKGTGSAPTRLPKHGRVEHRFGADHAALLWLHQPSWRIPSRCATQPFL